MLILSSRQLARRLDRHILLRAQLLSACVLQIVNCLRCEIVSLVERPTDLAYSWTARPIRLDSPVCNAFK